MKGGKRRGEGCLQGWGEVCWGCVRGGVRREERSII